MRPFAARNTRPLAALIALLALGGDLLPAQGTGKLRIYILAGQSNMEGHARIETFDYVGDDPATAPLLARMRGPDGRPRVCDGAWISLFTGLDDRMGETFGPLTAGFGSRRDPSRSDEKIGPEFTFGITMDESHEAPVLLIKTAWGGKSLFYDFRPPSAGPYPRSARDIAEDRRKEADSGRFYRLMLEHVRRVLADPGRVCPAYDPKQGFELGGFVWFQGFNDLVDRDAYPEKAGAPAGERFAPYGDLLAALIRDLRKDLEAPRLPVVIGVLGVDGPGAKPDVLGFRRAMAAPAALPEFRGTVTAVETAPFWSEELAAIDRKHEKVRSFAAQLRKKDPEPDDPDGRKTEARRREEIARFEAELISPAEAELWRRGASNGGYHYLGCARTFAQIGEAFARALLRMETGTKGR